MRKDIVVIGTSSGDIDALREVVNGLPSNFGGSIFVVVHMAPHSPGVLAGILERSGPHPVVAVRHREPIAPGHI